MRSQPPAWAVRTEADRRALADGYYWDADQAERIIRFAEAYVSPKYTRGAFALFEWQRRFLMSLYGWRRPDGGRRFAWAILHVPKKNGKTLLVSIVALYELVGAGEPSALVVSASTTKANAKQVYEQLDTCIKKAAKLASKAKPTPNQKIIEFPDRDAEYRALSADASGSEGLNCSAVIVDEAHAHKSPALFNALRYATAGRENGIVIVISTAGDDLSHFYYGFVQRARRIVAGEDLDATTYAEVYEANLEKDDVENPAVWKRCNPSLDLYPGYTSERFRSDLETARKDTGLWLAFLRYRLNVFKRSDDEGWIDLAKWDLCRGSDPDPDELLAAPCFIGFDGSQTTDPSSLSAVWLLPGRRYFVRSWAWVASEGVRAREKSNLPRYQQFEADDCMTITDGSVIDAAAIRAHLDRLRDDGHQIQKVVMDGTGYQVFGSELLADGYDVARMPQQMDYYAEPTRAFAEAVLGGSIVHDGNPWLRWCVGAVRLVTDTNNKSRPGRRKSVDKIDGAVATLMAFSQAHQATAPDPDAGKLPAAFLI